MPTPLMRAMIALWKRTVLLMCLYFVVDEANIDISGNAQVTNESGVIGIGSATTTVLKKNCKNNN